MLKKQALQKKRRLRRKLHIRKSITGTPDRLRLSVFKSSGHIYGQIINDIDQTTIVSASTIDKELKGQIKPDMKKMDKCRLVGETLAKRALEANIKEVAFDRNGYVYHGRIKALAEGARKGGLVF